MSRTLNKFVILVKILRVHCSYWSYAQIILPTCFNKGSQSGYCYSQIELGHPLNIPQGLPKNVTTFLEKKIKKLASLEIDHQGFYIFSHSVQRGKGREVGQQVDWHMGRKADNQVGLWARGWMCRWVNGQIGSSIGRLSHEQMVDF